MLKGERIITVLKVMFGLMLLSVLGLLIFGELYMPAEDPTGKGECILLEEGWERVRPDGTREAVTLPGRCEVEPGEVVRLERVLPENQEDMWFCMRASQQDMQVYVGDELRKEYTTKGSRLFGKDSASAFVFFRVEASDAGEVLGIELVSYSEYAGFLNEVYAGDRYDIVRVFVDECFEVLLVSFYMFVLSSIVVFIGVILRVVYKKKMEITYLGLGLLQLSMAMLVESRLRQFFLPNSSVASIVGFVLTILVPYPFMVYVSRVQKGRYEKAYHVLSLCVAANFVISTLLQVCGILDFAETMMVSYVMIVAMVLLMAVTICLDIKRGRSREYGVLVFGFLTMIVVSLWETYITFVPETTMYGGVALSFGLIILLFMASAKTVSDMVAAEREKQIAIAAGAAKTNFLANMSHEIRTPINTIIGMNEMILRENSSEAVREYAGNVQAASRLLLGLINDVLDFSKIEAGKMDILETNYRVSAMLTDVVNAIRSRADNKNLMLVVDVEESLPSVLKGDEIRIRQILNNLLSNAVKYTEEGTITFSVKGMRTGEEFALRMSVQDTGIGIKPEDKEKLFDSFRRLEEKKNRHIEGTGLGLNITKQLTELMGGRIEVESEYQKGSCFTVIIPQQVVDEIPMGKLEEAYREELSGEESTCKLYAPQAEILVVDDNDMNLAVASALLKRTGVKLTLAHSGRECLELCKKTKFDLILMDHMMPSPDGIETLHLLRADHDGPNRDTEVVVLTANAIAGMPEMYLAEGFADYLSKPIAAQALENMICKHLPEEKLESATKQAGEELESAVCTVDGLPERVAQEAGGKEAVDDALLHINKSVGMEYCANSEEFYCEMKAAYCEQGEEYLRKLSEAYEKRDWKSYKITVHALKGTSLLIGAAAFSERARQMELLAGEEREEALLPEHEKFMEEYRAMLQKVKE